MKKVLILLQILIFSLVCDAANIKILPGFYDISNNGDTIAFFDGKELLFYKTKKAISLVREDFPTEKGKVNIFEVPYYLPANRGIVIFIYHRYPQKYSKLTGIKCFDDMGDTPIIYKELWGANPLFSPDGTFFVCGLDYPWDQTELPQKIMICKTLSKEIRSIDMEKIHSISHKNRNTYHILGIPDSSDIEFSKDSKYFVFGIFNPEIKNVAFIYLFDNKGTLIEETELKLTKDIFSGWTLRYKISKLLEFKKKIHFR